MIAAGPAWTCRIGVFRYKAFLNSDNRGLTLSRARALGCVGNVIHNAIWIVMSQNSCVCGSTVWLAPCLLLPCSIEEDKAAANSSTRVQSPWLQCCSLQRQNLTVQLVPVHCRSDSKCCCSQLPNAVEASISSAPPALASADSYNVDSCIEQKVALLNVLTCTMMATAIQQSW